MKTRLKEWWARVPTSVRKGVVFVVGALCVIISPIAGSLPGPGGIPLFLLGIAILATEFWWAERFRDFILHYLRIGFTYLKAHKVIAIIFALGGLILSIVLSYFSLKYFKIIK